MIPLVAASEKGQAQTNFRNIVGVIRGNINRSQKIFLLDESAGKQSHRG